MLWKFNFQKKKIDLRKLNFRNIICLNSKNYNLEIQFPKVKKNDFRKFNFRNIIKLRIKKGLQRRRRQLLQHTRHDRGSSAFDKKMHLFGEALSLATWGEMREEV